MIKLPKMRMSAAASTLQGTAGAMILLSIMLPAPSYSANGNVYATACACTTTAQFANAAAVAAGNKQAAGNGTYIVVSTSAPMTAYMTVVMKWTSLSGVNFMVPQSETPINASGVVLTGQTEASLESNYGLLDVGLFGSRTNPKIVNVSYAYSASFINSDDAEVGPGIDRALATLGTNWADLPVGFTVTVNFSDGSSAQYIKTSQMSYHWVWTGVAHNAAKQKINRAGAVQANANTSGGGSGTVSGNYSFGTPNLSFLLDLYGLTSCSATVSIQIGDNESGTLATSGTSFFPC